MGMSVLARGDDGDELPLMFILVLVVLVLFSSAMVFLLGGLALCRFLGTELRTIMVGGGIDGGGSSDDSGGDDDKVVWVPVRVRTLFKLLFKFFSCDVTVGLG